MVFSSMSFLYGFLPLVLLLWCITPRKARNYVLLLASILFYAFGQPSFVLLLIFTAISNWIYGRLIERFAGTRRAKTVLISSVVINLALLGFFKYADFIIDSINAILGTAMPNFELPLPIGISFFLFQGMSYVIDVYRADVKAAKSLVNFSTYLCLFPQLIAGPVVRYQGIEEGLHKRTSSAEQVSRGVRRFTLGLSKKVLLANSMDALCSAFHASAGQSVLFYWVYAIAFTLQVYFDFSGYSDMAIGIGQVLGFRFPENFIYPYVSRSISEFWRRWHITLGSWFRDYVYIPLGGNRRGKLIWLRNIAIVWLLTGLWHGAAWNFALWGGIYGLLLMLEKLFLGPILEKSKVLSRIYVLFFVTVGFVIFNADGTSGMLMDLSALFGMAELPLSSPETLYYLRSYGLTLILALIGATPLVKMLATKYEETKLMLVMQPLCVGALLLLCTAFLVDGSFNPFLYFRF